MKRPTVLIADDHNIIIEGVSRIIADDFEVIGSVNDGCSLLEEVAAKGPDVVLLDISMPGCNGIDAANRLSKRSQPPKIIFLTMHSDGYFVREAFRAGASGYILKQSAGEELVNAIQKVLAGERYVTPLVLREAFPDGTMTDSEEPASLTPRERQVLQLLAEGKSVKEAAHHLNISVRTVEAHKYRLMDKLGLRSNSELVHYAIRIGLITV